MISEQRLKRAEGCLLGLACGDAVGAAVEFRQRGRFKPLAGMIGGGKFRLRKGEWTDNTAMALCVADSLLVRNGFDALDQMQRYLRCADEGYNSCRDYAFGIGKTIAFVLIRFDKTGVHSTREKYPRCGGFALSVLKILHYPIQNYLILVSLYANCQH